MRWPYLKPGFFLLLGWLSLSAAQPNEGVVVTTHALPAASAPAPTHPIFSYGIYRLDGVMPSRFYTPISYHSLPFELDLDEMVILGDKSGLTAIAPERPGRTRIWMLKPGGPSVLATLPHRANAFTAFRDSQILFSGEADDINCLDTSGRILPYLKRDWLFSRPDHLGSKATGFSRMEYFGQQHLALLTPWDITVVYNPLSSPAQILYQQSQAGLEKATGLSIDILIDMKAAILTGGQIQIWLLGYKAGAMSLVGVRVDGQQVHAKGVSLGALRNSHQLLDILSNGDIVFRDKEDGYHREWADLTKETVTPSDFELTSLASMGIFPPRGGTYEVGKADHPRTGFDFLLRSQAVSMSVAAPKVSSDSELPPNLKAVRHLDPKSFNEAAETIAALYAHYHPHTDLPSEIPTSELAVMLNSGTFVFIGQYLLEDVASLKDLGLEWTGSYFQPISGVKTTKSARVAQQLLKGGELCVQRIAASNQPT